MEYINPHDSPLGAFSRQKELLLQEIKITNERIAGLKKDIAHRALHEKTLERTLLESQRIAAQIVEEANINAQRILDEAEAIVFMKKNQIGKLNQEIALLQAELNESLTENTPLPQGEKSSLFCAEQISSKGTTADEKDNHLKFQQITTDDVYSMKLVGFVNARHFVAFGDTPGPIHSHSWQVEFDVAVPQNMDNAIEFNKVSKNINIALEPYENELLNSVYPFDLIQPTTENIAMFFYNRVCDFLQQLGLKLTQLILWESPTRGIHVRNYNWVLDEQIDLQFKAQDASSGTTEAAAALSKHPVQPEEAETDKKQKTPLKKIPFITIGPTRGPYTLQKYLLAIAIIIVVSVLVYSNVLWPQMEERFPWGSDSWGHLYKGELLYEQIGQGNYYPQFTQYWYNGVQPFRYWAPLPYYALAFLRLMTGDIFIAGNIYIYLCALFGALTWLLLAKRMGLGSSVLAGLIWLIWQDNVRVAFSEGNLPRTLATALLPLLFVYFLKIIVHRESRVPIILTVLTIHLVLLCHAMIAAVYAISLTLFAFFLWVFQGCSFKDLIRGVLVLIVGIASSFWWLLPSLSGGITGIDAQAVKEVVQFVPAQISLSPISRFENVEIFYWGLSLIAIFIFNLIAWKSKPAWAKSLTICGGILIFITFPFFRAIYITLPLSHLLWPLRFSSFAALAVLASAFTFERSEKRPKWLQDDMRVGIILLLFGSFLFFDCFITYDLLGHTATEPFVVSQSNKILRDNKGWRVATLDLSQLGSAPSYVFSTENGLEQVFGWAWQGAVTSKNIMLLNTALEDQLYPFLFRSCLDLGATSLVVKEDIITDSKAFYNAATKAGYERTNNFANVSIWKGIDNPYLIQKSNCCLTIGKHGGVLALLFPKIEIGSSDFIDDYSLEELNQYAQIILSGANWHSKKQAEDLISQYALLGGRVIVEMSGIPANILAKQPEFLGIYGEAVSIKETIEIKGGDVQLELSPLWLDDGEWKAYVPIGLDKVELEFSYYGNEAPVLGYKIISGQKIWFLGANLSYYGYKSGHRESIQLMKDVLGYDEEYSRDLLIPFLDYQISDKGYHLTYQLEEAGEVIIPIALVDGLVITLDDELIDFGSYENLIKLHLPGGVHKLDLLVEKTPVFLWSELISIMVILLLILFLILMKRKGAKE